MYKLAYLFLAVAFIMLAYSALIYAMVTLFLVLFIWYADRAQVHKNNENNKDR